MYQPQVKGAANAVALAELDDALPPPVKADRSPDQKHRFILTHHWRGWEFIPDGKGGGEFLPRIAQVPLIPGVAGVDDHLNANKLIAAMANKGAHVWLNGDARLGPYAQFLGRYALKGGGAAFVCRFAQRARVMPGQPPTTTFTTDSAAWTKFRRYVRDNVVPPMTDLAFDVLVEVAVKTAEQMDAIYKDPDAHPVRAAWRLVDAIRTAGETYFAAISETLGEEMPPVDVDMDDDQIDQPLADQPTPAEARLAARKAKPKAAE